ncbi:MAG TPA: transposase [Kofleriaceae bacterium]|nr:transposase [Kofleriaceae bacterium]
MSNAMRRIGWTQKNAGCPRAGHRGSPSAARGIPRSAAQARLEKADIRRRVRVPIRLAAALRLGTAWRRLARQIGRGKLEDRDDDWCDRARRLSWHHDDRRRGELGRVVAYIEQVLAPNLRPGDIGILDNLAAHKSPRALQAMRDTCATPLFLPPYSPDLNPIEKAWAKLKDFIRRMHTLTRAAFDAAIVAAMDVVSLDHLRGWAGHAGYDLSST